MTKAARGWAQARPLEGEPGSYYLRLRKNGKPTFESVGDDLANAVQEMKARQKALANHAPAVVLAPRLTLHKAIADFLQTKEAKENWQYQLEVFGDWYGWEKDPAELKRMDWKAYLIRDKRPTDTCPVGWSNVSEAYLAKWTGFSERTVRAAIQTLVKDEMVFRKTYPIPGGFRKNRYALNMEAIKAALRPEFNLDVEEPQAGETYTHRRNRPVPQAGETEATGGSRLKAVGFSSWGKQVDSAVTQADQTDTARFAETPSVRPGEPGPVATHLSAYLEDDEDSPSPVKPEPSRVIPPTAPVREILVIVNRASGHRFAQTHNGQRCLACKTHYSQYQRDHKSCPNEEVEIEAVERLKEKTPDVPKAVPKPDPADYDMDDLMERSNYKRALLEWKDSQHGKGPGA